MVDKVRTALQALTAAQKAWAAIAGMALGLSGVAVALSGQLKLPAEVVVITERVASLDERVGSLEAKAPQTEYLFCVDLSDRGLISKTPQECFQDYSLRAQP